MFTYPVKLEKDKATGMYVASCRDLPLMNSVGDSIQCTLQESIHGLVTAVSIEIDEGRTIPSGSKIKNGEYAIPLPEWVATKASLHNAMIESGLQNTE
ncbi:hypothetical protein U2T78_003853 [Providencia stuartii]|uniref:HicB-like antitoxin of toxin-antitoxin system domain-containing protein n=2 Tax=Providencia stuartii TaxID=588 RepID=A0AAJ1JKN8_PROST|nr:MULTISPECIES: hypothetical protein [Providencia]AFH91909.1 hth-type transcriptional regulator [Providencia stuartii MRSN 2154]EMA3643061.1 hypothetical protein [Providencia stuartii]MBW3103360.1 hypothetical protein [Providencia stuartii]MCB5218822.1 hypothetical protein [Providencia stuartii]MDE5306533.1 hypothetical protein [Providencia stuartii]